MNNVIQDSWNLFDWKIGLKAPLFLIAGPCVIESEQMAIDTAGYLKDLTQKLNINFIYKSSYDKANRSSGSSFRGFGITAGLEILAKVKKQIQVPILTDVHDISEVDEVANVVDILQTPAFLCRQTDFINKVATSGKVVNIKKGQFLSPYEMNNVVDKAKVAQGNQEKLIMICERGFTFGYNNLIADMRSLAIMQSTSCPIIFDATHSVQLPGAKGLSSGGERQFVEVLARAATAVGISGLFLEVHPNPEKALSDGPNALFLNKLEPFLNKIIKLDKLTKEI